jgi:lipopolysaccharide export system protein LptA
MDRQSIFPPTHGQTKNLGTSIAKIFHSAKSPQTQILLEDTTSPAPEESIETSITSDKLEIALVEDQTEFLFTGNVKLVTASFGAECTVAKVIASGSMMNLAPNLDSIKQISITGPLVLKQGERSCSADRAEITTTDTTLMLFGNATVRDPMGTISASEIRINYMTKSVEISGTPHDKPVTLNISNLPQ